MFGNYIKEYIDNLRNDGLLFATYDHFQTFYEITE